MSRSRSVTPLHGFDERHLPVTQRRPDGDPDQPRLQRRGRSQSSADSRVGADSEQSLEWDDYNHTSGEESDTFCSPNDTLGSVIEINSSPGTENSGPGDTEASGTPQTSPTGSTMPGRTPSPFSRADIPALVAAELKVLKRATMAWNDEYMHIVPQRLTTARLTKILDKAEEYKDNVANSIIEIKSSMTNAEDSAWVIQVEAQVKTLREKLCGFILEADTTLGLREQQSLAVENAAAAGAKVKKARVDANLNTLTEEMDKMKVILGTLDTAAPSDEPAFKMHMDNVEAAKAKSRELIEDAKELVDDAVQAGLVIEATDLDKNIQALKQVEAATVSTLSDKKQAFGIIGELGAARVIDVPVPTFSGNPTEQDFYTFQKHWTRYIGSKYMSEAEKRSVLLMAALTGQARQLAERYETIPEIFEQLRVVYGNPRYLLSTKLEELRKLGSCTGNSTKRREWAVDVMARLEALKVLATTHKLLDKLYHSTIVGEIQAGLSGQMLKAFKEKVKEEDATGNLSGEQYYTVLLSTLVKMISQLTFEVNYDLNLGSLRGSDYTLKDGQKKQAAGGRRAPDAGVHVVVDEPVDRQPKGNAREPRKKTKGKKSTSNSKDVTINSTVTICANYKDPIKIKCNVCSNEHKHAFACSEFQQARGKERIGVVSKMKCCFRCLRLDSCFDKDNRESWWKNHDPQCKTEWVCNIGKCPTAPKIKQYHILMCLFHVDQNKEKEALFIKSMDKDAVTANTRFFFNAAMYQLDALPPQVEVLENNELKDHLDPTIFMLQYVEHDGKRLMLFYDSGCGGAAISKAAAEILGTVVVRPGPTLLNTAGAVATKIPGGDERFKLRLEESGKLANITGLKMEALTNPFPIWDLAKAWEDISAEIEGTGTPLSGLPTLPPSIGGCAVDIFIGIRYIKLFPTLLFTLPSGLAVYKSQFSAPNGHLCVLGGPHPAWRKCREEANYLGPHGFFTSEMKAYFFSTTTLLHVYSPPDANILPVVEELLSDGEGGLVGDADGDELDGVVELDFHNEHVLSSLVNLFEPPITEDNDIIMSVSDQVVDCHAVHCSNHVEDIWNTYPDDWAPPSDVYTVKDEERRFSAAEHAGSEITYRCVRCRQCSDCRNSGKTESISFREEAEQHQIEAAVEYVPAEKRLVSKLPFIASPKENLFQNRYAAEKVLDSQMKRVNASEDVKNDILTSFEKLASRGFFLPVSVLDQKKKSLIYEGDDAGYYIPWRTVYKEASLSTPCRMVFDASARTPGGTSLNDILCKGENRLANIHNILLKFRSKPAAFTCDIRMAYNMVSLDPAYLRYHRFLWKEGLEESSPVVDYVVTTLIYGVRPVGNCLIAGFKKLADYVLEHHPEQAAAGVEALLNSIYVDDVAHADETAERNKATAESLDFVLSMGSMEVKGYTFSGQPPPEELTADGETVGLVGMAWGPEKDWISLSIKPLYFGKPKRGKLPDIVTGDFAPALKKNFTRRTLLSKIAGVYDPMGLTTPITARLKLDLHDVFALQLGWDEPVPDSYLEKWIRNISDIQMLRDIRFRRCIIPEDAESLDIELVISADASQFIAVAAVHGRVKRKNGEYSATLMSAKSRLVSELTIPKGELRGCVLAVHLAQTVLHNYKEQIISTIYVTDSSIVLFWINTDQRPLEVTVRNAVIEIRRFTDPQHWHHVESSNNIADLGTRYTEVDQITEHTEWQTGKQWMHVDRAVMPIKDLKQTKISQEEKRIAAEEIRNDNISGIFLPLLATKVTDRYVFSRYIVDPNRYSWVKAVKVMGFILKYVRIRIPRFKPEWAPQPHPDTNLTAMYVRDLPALEVYDIRYAEAYFFRQATKELLEFTTEKERRDLDLRNGILYHAGRILDGQEIHTPVDVMFDVSPLHFVKPAVDRYSPCAYAIMAHAHCNLSNHRGVPNTLRCSKEIAYILRGRDLAMEIRDSCQSCIRYRAKLTRVEMGKMHDARFTIAPAFFLCQVDLMGPLLARCKHNHRSTVKIWAAVFKDPASCAVSVHAMDGYTTEDFICAYTRFSSRHGHPSELLIDEGSNLMAAAKKMEISITDIGNGLSTKFGTGLKFSTAPVQGHNVTGMVERSIQSVKRLFDRTYKGLKLDILGFETAFAWISSALNAMPICLGSRVKDIDHLEIITPARLIMGRSSMRSIGGHARIESPSKLVAQMDKVYEHWWEIWREEKIIDFIPQPTGWKNNNDDLQVGDIVLMLQNANDVKLGGPIWRIARVQSLETSHRDGLSRVAICEYKIPGEQEFRTTRRSVRKLAVIHHEDDIPLVVQLNEAARKAGEAFFLTEVRSEIKTG